MVEAYIVLGIVGTWLGPFISPVLALVLAYVAIHWGWASALGIHPPQHASIEMRLNHEQATVQQETRDLLREIREEIKAISRNTERAAMALGDRDDVLVLQRIPRACVPVADASTSPG